MIDPKPVLEDLASEYHEPPEAPKWLLWIGWTCFSAISFAVLFTLCVLSAEHLPTLRWLALWLPRLLLVAFAGSAGLTLWSARGFSGRAAGIREVLTLKPGDLYGGPNTIRTKDAGLIVKFSSGASEGHFTIGASNGYVPNPYRVLGASARFEFQRYIDLIDAETAAARKEIAKLAVALGGSFALGMLTWSRILVLIKDLTPP